MKKIYLLLSALLTILMSSCGDDIDSQVEDTISEYLNSRHPSIDVPSDRLHSQKFPATYAETRSIVEELNALHKLGLLNRKTVQVETDGIIRSKKVNGYEYDLTEKGKSLLTTKYSKFLGEVDCFKVGGYELVEIVNKTEPSQMMGHTVIHVSYIYKSTGIESDFINSGLLDPKSVGDRLERKDTLVKTEKGWIHEKLWTE